MDNIKYKIYILYQLFFLYKEKNICILILLNKNQKF